MLITANNMKYKQFKYWTVEKVVGTKLWTVKEPFHWLIDHDEPTGWAVIMREWFETDYWSIPRILWIFLNPTKYNAYLVHDRLYNAHFYENIETEEKKDITRLEADRLLIKVMEYEKATFLEKFFVYWWVRWWWWIAWKN